MRLCVRVYYVFCFLRAVYKYINRCVSTKATVIRRWARANFPTTTEYVFHPRLIERYFCTSFYSASVYRTYGSR